MTLQSSGTIRWSEIRDEFGANIGGTGVSLGRYRNSDSNFGNKNVGTLTDLPLDVGVPKSGTISASSFYSKKLNMVLDMYSGGTEFRVHCRTRYNDSSKVKVVGNYRSRPTNVSGTRVIVNVNKTFGSEEGTHITTCAVKTGDWGANSSTDLDIEIGSQGKIYGAGGDGGDGGSANGSAGGDGKSGSTALGVQYPCSINNLGRIQAGYGGGGGGGGRREYRRSGKKGGRWVGSSGGGGGGGAGLPTSTGGDSPNNAFGGGSNGSDGGNGSNESSGNGGGGGQDAGAGGNGGAVNNSSTSGSSGVSAGGSGGNGGANGWAIVTTNATTDYTISGGGSVVGRQKANVIVY